MAVSVIDFHAHILPSLDDGSRSDEMTGQMLQSAKEQGIDAIVATPHFYADSMRMERFLQKREQAFFRAEKQAQEHGIRLFCGAEAAFFSGIGKAAGIEMLQIENTDLLMLEMPFRAWSAYDIKEIDQLLRRGIQPVIAHLERYFSFQTDREIIPLLLDMPVSVQINAECLLYWRTRRRALKLFESGQAHLLGSDSHNMSSRPQNLKAGRAVLERKLGKKYLVEMDKLGTSLLGME